MNSLQKYLLRTIDVPTVECALQWDSTTLARWLNQWEENKSLFDDTLPAAVVAIRARALTLKRVLPTEPSSHLVVPFLERLEAGEAEAPFLATDKPHYLGRAFRSLEAAPTTRPVIVYAKEKPPARAPRPKPLPPIGTQLELPLKWKPTVRYYNHS